ncbi:MAG: ectoine synthase [Chromatiales bacterium]|nr:ectoine synthase [Chromatiales bacterium]
MIVRHMSEIINSDREVEAPNGNWVSRRLLLDGDGMGFSLHETIIRAGTETHIWYKNHVEAVYCVAGRGQLEDLETGEIVHIEDGVMYALDLHDEHLLSAEEDMRLICVFNPPVTGREVHDKDGAYQPHPRAAQWAAVRNAS